MQREEVKDRIRKGIPCGNYLHKAPVGNYCCPFCGSGENKGHKGHKPDGALNWYKRTNTFHCFSCGKSGDVIDLHMQEHGLDYNAALEDLARELGLEIDPWKPGRTTAQEDFGQAPSFNGTEDASKGNAPERPQDAPEGPGQAAGGEDYTGFYKQAHEDLKASREALDYLHGRGITDENIERFNLGYCAAWKHSKAPGSVRPTKRIIIPRTAGTYTARRIDEPANEIEARYVKQLQGSQSDLFNLGAMEGAGAVFVCEGELDAISLYQAGAGAVVGIGSIVNVKHFPDEARKHPGAVYILALDNDPDEEGGRNRGKDAQIRLAEDMRAVGLEVMSVDPAQVYGDAKDGNGAYTKDPERLKKIVGYLQGVALETKARLDEEREAELKKRTGEGMLDAFLATVTDPTARTFEAIPTGIKDIDKALGGGFIRKTLVTLGAPPAMGKTALAQWIFENVAAAGHDVLYINLEMSREQLLARSLSRLVWKYEKKDYTSLDVLRGYAWTDEQREAIMAAAGRYKAEIAPHFIYNPDGVTNGINSIMGAIEVETTRIKATGRPAPLVCLDYLQLVDSGERDAIEGLKNVIFKLKDYAKAEDTVVLVIIANNRASNKTGTVDMESGRDTSAIEYSGDVMLGLAYTAIEDRRKYEHAFRDEDGNKMDPEKGTYSLDVIRRMKKEAYEYGEEIPAVCKQISLKVLKNRFEDSERRANLLFDGKHSTFSQVAPAEFEEAAGGDGWETYTGDTPFL